jgi:hypothetical protein
MGMNETRRRRGYEQRDLSVGGVALFATSLVIALIVVHYLAMATFRRLALQPSKYPPPSSLAAVREGFTGPRLLVNQDLDMERLRASEDALLNNYDWVDRNHGIVRIPISRAMELLVQQSRVP